MGLEEAFMIKIPTKINGQTKKRKIFMALIKLRKDHSFHFLAVCLSKVFIKTKNKIFFKKIVGLNWKTINFRPLITMIPVRYVKHNSFSSNSIPMLYMHSKLYIPIVLPVVYEIPSIRNNSCKMNMCGLNTKNP